MINTSLAFRRALSGNREFRIKDTITLKNKKEFPIPMMDLREYKINEATSASGQFEIGAAVIKEYKITLDNWPETGGRNLGRSEKRAVSGIYGNIWRNHTANHSL